MPKTAGVYLMKDRSGRVLYVGKAKNLRNRVRSYFFGGDGRPSVPFLVATVASIDTVVTEDERQAIVLESDLIKKYKPRYNIRLKDDKAHLVVRVDMNQDWPRLEVVRKVEEDGARYIGPFAFGYEARVLLDIVRRTVPLRTCSDSVLHNRVRPCLEYEIKRCSGPCVLPVDRGQYFAWVETAIEILEGKNEQVAARLEAEMERAGAEMRFEDAADYRDRLEVLSRLTQERVTSGFPMGSRDAFGLFREGRAVEVSVLSVRRGRLFDVRTFGLGEVEIPNEELLTSLLSQYYLEQHEIPEEILLPFPIEDRHSREQLFSEKRGGAVHILTPQRGAKARLLALALANARENFGARFGGEDRSDETLRSLQRELGLEQMPRTIECVDISHFQGSATVASVVRFQDGKPDKQRYRHFYLSQEGKPDDFASMREVTRRHLSRGVEEHELADLVIIDGGAAQLSQAVKERNALGLSTPVMVGLAKKRRRVSSYHNAALRDRKPERVFFEGESLPLVLKPDSDALRLLERIRDEAHRFAVSFHRKARTRRAFESPLDRIPGVGPTRRKLLLKTFGSLRALRAATPEEVSERAGLPPALAARIVSLLARSAPPEDE